MKAIITELEEQSGKGPYGIKDPRMSLTLPMWHDVISYGGAEQIYTPYVVVCWRNPNSIVKSLLKRDPNVDETHMYKITAEYQDRMLMHIKQLRIPSTIVRYDDLFESPIRAMSRACYDIWGEIPGNLYEATQLANPLYRHFK